MAQLSVRPDELRARAREMESLRKQHQQIIKQMRILVANLSDSWKGEAQDAFVANFAAKNKVLVEFDQTIGRYIDVTNKAADEAEAADNRLLAAVRRL